MKSEKEKCRDGELYDANNDSALIAERTDAKRKCRGYNGIDPGDTDGRAEALSRFLGGLGENCIVEQPFYCDYGYNIYLGDNFFSNFNCVILDAAPVHFGNNVFVGPNCGFYTSGHPLEPDQRNTGLEYAHPISVGNNVWIGAGVSVLPGVTIGDNCVIGAGSVVVNDIPDGFLAVGNPCRAIRKIK